MSRAKRIPLERDVLYNGLQDEMMCYYDERAQEYDEVYTGCGPALHNPHFYREDVHQIEQLVSAFGRGNLIDIGSGTGFWLPHYAPNCMTVTLIDQSDRMLAECRRRVAAHKLSGVCHLIKGDFFTHRLPKSYESSLAGFFLSHLPSSLEGRFFDKLKGLLTPAGQFMLIDSVWNEMRSRTSPKEGRVARRLNDGRTFAIYKRYFDRSEVHEMCRREKLEIEASYFGQVFFAVAGRWP